MKLVTGCLLLANLWFFMGCVTNDNIPGDLKNEFPESLSISVKNPLDASREDAAIVLDVQKLTAKAGDFNAAAFLVWSGNVELASQALDRDGDGQADEIVVISDYQPGETRELVLLYAPGGEKSREYPKRTQAELSRKVGGEFVDHKYQGGTFQNVEFLRPPAEHTDHDEFIRYEGPGWESDKVGYRFYLDWRNATDIFGKKVPDMVLQKVGLDGFDSYHEMSAWGMDILHVGESLGIGSVGIWHDGKAQRVAETDSLTCEIVANGAVYSQIRTRYFGWKVGANKYNLVSDLSISAGSRMTRHELQIQGDPPNLCTGLVKHPESHLLPSEDSGGEWTYLASYGKQSLAGDNLGMAVLYRTADRLDLTEDEFSQVVVLKPSGGRLSYYFLAAWEQEPGGIPSEEAFAAYLKKTLSELDAPLIIDY